MTHFLFAFSNLGIEVFWAVVNNNAKQNKYDTSAVTYIKITLTKLQLKFESADWCISWNGLLKKHVLGVVSLSVDFLIMECGRSFLVWVKRCKTLNRWSFWVKNKPRDTRSNFHCSMLRLLDSKTKQKKLPVYVIVLLFYSTTVKLMEVKRNTFF